MYQGSEEFLRFQREAKILSQLRHKNIVSVYAFDFISSLTNSEDQIKHTPFIVMEYLQGQSLKKYLLDNRQLTEDEVIEISRQAIYGLRYAHEAGVIHRDLSSANLFLVLENESIKSERSSESTELLSKLNCLKIIDFGLSNITQNFHTNREKLTETGLLVGNPSYMSPEQCRGENLTTTSDIYSLGCVIYECLQGCRPFESDNAIGLLFEQQNKYPREPSFSSKNKKRSEHLKYILLRCLQKEAKYRFSSAEELLTEFELLKNKNFDFDLKKKNKLGHTWYRNNANKLVFRSNTYFLSVLILSCFLLTFVYCQRKFVFESVVKVFTYLDIETLYPFEKSLAEYLISLNRYQLALPLLLDLEKKYQLNSQNDNRTKILFLESDCLAAENKSNEAIEILSKIFFFNTGPKFSNNSTKLESNIFGLINIRLAKWKFIDAFKTGEWELRHKILSYLISRPSICSRSKLIQTLNGILATVSVSTIPSRSLFMLAMNNFSYVFQNYQITLNKEQFYRLEIFLESAITYANANKNDKMLSNSLENLLAALRENDSLSDEQKDSVINKLISFLYEHNSQKAKLFIEKVDKAYLFHTPRSEAEFYKRIASIAVAEKNYKKALLWIKKISLVWENCQVEIPEILHLQGMEAQCYFNLADKNTAREICQNMFQELPNTVITQKLYDQTVLHFSGQDNVNKSAKITLFEKFAYKSKCNSDLATEIYLDALKVIVDCQNYDIACDLINKYIQLALTYPLEKQELMFDYLKKEALKHRNKKFDELINKLLLSKFPHS